MAVAFRSSAISTASASSDTVTVTKPSGLAVGDVMVACMTAKSNSTTCTATGWTQLDTVRELVVEGGRAYTYYKVADSTDVAASNFTWTFNTTLAGTQGAIMAFSGVDTTNPINQHTFALQTVGSVQTAPAYANGVTPIADCMLVFMNTGGTGGPTVTAVSNYAVTTSSPTWTEAYDSYTNTVDSTVWGLAGAYGLRSQSTDTGNSSCSFSVAAYTMAALIALAPAPVIAIKHLTLLGIGK